LQPGDGVINELIDNGFGGLEVVDNSGSLAHQPWACIVQGLVINVVRKFLEVIFDWNDALLGKLFNICGTVFFPVLDIWVVANTEWAPLEEELENRQRKIYKAMSNSQ
jgi:hypothetical protein